MLNNKKIAIAKHNASKKRHADIFTGCLALGTLKQTQQKIKAYKIPKNAKDLLTSGKTSSI